MTGEQVDAWVEHDASFHPLTFRDLLFQAGETGHIANREQLVMLQYQGRCRTDGGDNIALQMHLADFFHQQRAIAKTFCTLDTAR
ncbi:hypothetical protein D3C80_1529360 [compost metagenome]